MKYILVGLHSSGKQEVVDILEKKGIKCGHQFSNIEEASSKVYNSYNYELYSTLEVHNIFENNAYVFLHSLNSINNTNSYRYYEGLSFYEYDVNDVFIMSPDQVIDIPKNFDLGDVCFVWLDNTKDNRLSRYANESRMYNFKDRETLESVDMDSFIKEIYKGRVLYFTNEDPMRVAAVLYALIQHPDLFNEFIEAFN